MTLAVWFDDLARLLLSHQKKKHNVLRLFFATAERKDHKTNFREHQKLLVWTSSHTSNQMHTSDTTKQQTVEEKAP